MTPEEQAKLVKLAGMKCPGGHDGNQPPWPQQQGHRCVGCAQGLHKPHDECSTCHGSGYLLAASVRVPCTVKGGLIDDVYVDSPDHATHVKCAGRGWIPSGDFVTWCWALEVVGAYAVRLGLNPRSVSVFWEEAAWECGIPGQLIDAEAVLTALARR